MHRPSAISKPAFGIRMLPVNSSQFSRAANARSHAAQLRPSRPAVNAKARPRRASRPAKALWDDSMTLSDLQNQLETALQVEDYQLAAKLRDTIQQKQVDSRLAVEEANRKFYKAFGSGKIQEMAEIWGEGEHVSVVHPAANTIAGREQVLASWQQILRGVRPGAFKITLEDLRVMAFDDVGYVTCTEILDNDDSTGRIAATNVFERQRGQWKITLHHGSPAPPLRLR